MCRHYFISEEGREFAHPGVSGLLSSFRIEPAAPYSGERLSYLFQCLVAPNVSALFDKYSTRQELSSFITKFWLRNFVKNELTFWGLES